MTRRILATVLAACALGVVVFFVPTAILVRQQNEHADRLELQQLALVAARVAATRSELAVPGADDPDGYHQYARYGVTGRRTAGAGPDPADAAVTAALRGEATNLATDAEIVATAPIGSQPIRGAVRVSEPLAVDRGKTAVALGWLALLGLAAIGAAGVAGWWLLRRLLVPVAALRGAAERLGQGDFTVTVPRTGLPEFDELGAALTSSARRVGRLVERERAFSADASHELRTPLAAVMVALETELLSRRAVSHAVLRHSVEVLARMERTVDELLHLVRDPAGRREPVEVCRVLRRLATDWRRASPATGRPITVRCPGTRPVVVSEAALRHILDVLIDNALRHGDGEVVIFAEPVRGGVVIGVSDAGPGPARPDTVFERRSPEASGTGIGLALARTLAEAEGARLTLRRGRPTTFELLLPQGTIEARTPAEAAGT